MQRKKAQNMGEAISMCMPACPAVDTLRACPIHPVIALISAGGPQVYGGSLKSSEAGLLVWA